MDLSSLAGGIFNGSHHAKGHDSSPTESINPLRLIYPLVDGIWMDPIQEMIKKKKKFYLRWFGLCLGELEKGFVRGDEELQL